jgi:hypothetical protein
MRAECEAPRRVDVGQRFEVRPKLMILDGDGGTLREPSASWGLTPELSTATVEPEGTFELEPWRRGQSTPVGLTAPRSGTGALALSWSAGGQNWHCVTQVTATVPLLHPRSAHSATLLENGEVLLAGGTIDGEIDQGAMEVFEPTTGTVRDVARMPAARHHHFATWLGSGQVLFLGGQSSSGEISTGAGMIWDARSDGFLDGGSWGWLEVNALHSLTATTAVAFSGQALSQTCSGLCPAILDTAAGTMRLGANLTSSRSDYAITRLDGDRFLLTGGANYAVVFVQAEIYDATADQWSSMRQLGAPRRRHSATRLSNGEILVAGGQHRASADPYAEFVDDATTEIYSPTTNRWRTAAQMPSPSSEHTALLLPSGRVLFTGGTLPFPVLFYDPQTNSWSAPTLPPLQRKSATVTLLPDGTVLFAGGEGTPDLEVFTPLEP